MRANIRLGPTGLAPLMLWGRYLNSTNTHRPLMCPAMKQVDVSQEAIDKRTGWVLPDVIRSTNLFNNAGIHQHNTVRDFQGLLLIVCHEDRSNVKIVVESPQPATQFFANLCIKCTEGLIKQKYLWLYSKCARQGDSLTLTTR